MANNLIDITDHFTWKEAVVTNKKGFSNVIADPAVFRNVVITAQGMEKVRALLAVPITVNSWYRCPELNRAIGGAKRSDHLIGAAVDFVAPDFGDPLAICKKLIEHSTELDFKQLILEHTWVHISWNMIPNSIQRLEVLSSLAGGGYAKGLTNSDGQPYA